MGRRPEGARALESFRWDTYFVTGLRDVDDQHHELVDVMNRFGARAADSEGASAEELRAVCDDLANYARYHFTEEEGMMRAEGLDPRHLADHLGQHAAFLDEVGRQREGVHDPAAAQRLMRFLIQWLTFHILRTDQFMARQVTARRAGRTPSEAFRDAWSTHDPATEALVASLNGLFQLLSERNRELFALNRSLEDRVAARTRELSTANERLEHMALSDALTGLPNRRHAMRALQRAWDEPSDAASPLACMMIDADGFKQINDGYGHDAGDEVLRGLARQLVRSLRTDDVVCRLGGDEFLVLSPRTSLADAAQVAEKLRRDVAALRVPAGAGAWNGSISVGVAVRTDAMGRPEDLLKAADEAVYAAKRLGRNRVAVAE